LYINILSRELKSRESKRLQAAGQWSISALGGVQSDFVASALGLLATAIIPLASVATGSKGRASLA